MKLELKHLAPYLPYGLKVYHEGHIAIIVSLYLPAGNYRNDLWVVSMEDSKDPELSCAVNFKQVQPILRPLSDLIKEITVEGYSDGKPFKPISDLVGLITQSGYNYNRVVSIKEEHDTITVEWPIVHHPKSSEGIRKFFEIDIDEIGFDLGWELWNGLAITYAKRA